MNSATTQARSLETLRSAFAFVCPREHAQKLADAGLITAADVERHSWRDPIGAIVIASDLAVAGLTIEDVSAAVEHYTATAAKVTAYPIKGTGLVEFLTPEPGFFVEAKGYRAGPAGP